MAPPKRGFLTTGTLPPPLDPHDNESGGVYVSVAPNSLETRER
eukprot:CAMPEP_0194424730 /NCGR_PEP_ID=MMETSP0176-20130528/24046_1 /TAXON_ID=216777 /ORGANISM="Proboscia alata, Strain PI-D3" /LENGTH=42 /DNA_ID= /DNA_START= /DNA_END= /DNA_ORIENTATION=